MVLGTHARTFHYVSFLLVLIEGFIGGIHYEKSIRRERVKGGGVRWRGLLYYGVCNVQPEGDDLGVSEHRTADLSKPGYIASRHALTKGLHTTIISPNLSFWLIGPNHSISRAMLSVVAPLLTYSTSCISGPCTSDGGLLF